MQMTLEYVNSITIILLVFVFSIAILYALYNMITGNVCTDNKKSESVYTPLIYMYNIKDRLEHYVTMLHNNIEECDQLIKIEGINFATSLKTTKIIEDEDKISLAVSLWEENLTNLKNYHTGDIKVSEFERQSLRISHELSRLMSKEDGEEDYIEITINELFSNLLSYYDCRSTSNIMNCVSILR